ncbi:acyl-CoA dehydrogenase family protein [Roseomonas sp. CCTCC AB2023176]|uniref:acyl-CoA dehydrogenase family protein n=1 Tax=Roseomonas sp. CCTCC AB2023176 TaxID=3342640 RepID=UPI0035E2C5F5
MLDAPHAASTTHSSPLSHADALTFALTRLHDLPALTGGALGTEDVAAIVAEASRMAEEVLSPAAPRPTATAASSRTAASAPPRTTRRRQAWREGGWQSLPAPAEHGGQGLPQALWVAVLERASSADMAFMLLPILSAGAIELLAKHATPDQAARYLPPLVSAEWNGTMCLTEPQSGSDLSTLRTKAVPDGNGGFRVSGQKIYISFGEHDLTPNTLHLVLARLPDAPPGSRGISLFAVPKMLRDGRHNGVRCGGIERKPGIHAAPTCTMLFEEAEAELIGEPHRGLPAMFAMMNNARLAVGVEGVGQAARALDLAEAYAETRIQGGAAIARHADVARMLSEMRAVTLAARFLALDCAVALDRGDADRAALLTPIVKAWCTDRGIEVASIGVQVHGGAGYVEDSGAAQIWRDSRIAAIYEGTNGIQAMDLAARKLPKLLPAFRALAEEAAAADPLLAGPSAALARAAETVSTSPDPGEGAVPLLDAAGWILGGAWLARAAALEPGFAEASRFFLRRILPRAASRLQEATAATEG